MPPPLPEVQDMNLTLEVYAGSTSSSWNDEYGNADRLIILGKQVLELAIAYHYFCLPAKLLSTEIGTKAQEALSDDNVTKWYLDYGLEQRVRYPVNSPEEKRRFFFKLVGASYLRNGMPMIQGWISGLLDENFQPLPPPGPPPPEPSSPPPQSPPPTASPSRPAVPPQQQPHYGQAFQATPPPVPTLALVNQTATQKGMTITYRAEHVSGPVHMPIWRVHCSLNGVDYGVAEGRNQKVAKEDAARQAWINLGWGG